MVAERITTTCRELILGLALNVFGRRIAFARAWRAQVRLHHRSRSLTTHGKRSTVATVAVARELCGFLWAAMTHQPLRDDAEVAAA